MSDSVSILSNHVCQLGEGPSYDPGTDTLFWFDIVNGHMLAQRSGGETQVHELGLMASAIAIIDDERQLIATETGLHVRDAATGKMTLHTAVEADNKETRSNDARVHPSGALWFSTMAKTEAKGRGAIYWFFKGEVRTLYDRITVPNSICFTEDGRTAYYTDTETALLMRVACDPENGLPVGEPKVFVDNRGGAVAGFIDGSVADRDGVVWNASWGGNAVNAYSPEGALLRSIAIPALQASCPAFFGKDASRLAVTSAWKGMNEAERAADPDGGKTFLVDLPVRGRFEPRVLIG